MKKILYCVLIGFYSQLTFALNLDEVLEHTYQHNNLLKSARESLNAQEEVEFRAVTEFLPTVTAYSNRKMVNAKQGILLSQEWKESAEGIAVRQSVFQGGKSIANLQKTKNEVKAENAKFLDTEQKVLFSAIEAYADVIESTQLKELSRKKVEVFTKHLYAVTERAKLKDATKSEVAKALARLENVKSELLKNISKKESAQAVFENVTELKAENLEIPNISQFQAVSNLEDLKDNALRANPSLIESNYRVDASKYEVLKQAASFLPTADLSYSISKSRNVDNSGLKRKNKVLAFEITVPLYQGGAEYSNLNYSKKLQSARKYDHQRIVNNVIEGVVKVWHEQQVAMSLIESTKAEEKAAAIALESVNQESEMQLNTITDVLDAEQDLFEAHVESIKACTNLMKAYYKIKLITGTLTAKDLSLKTL